MNASVEGLELPRSAIVLLVSLGLAVGLGQAATATTSGTLRPDQPTVSRIVDGDTIDVTIHGDVRRIRFLNVNTPEVGTCLADEARSFTARHARVGSGVSLSYDRDRTDGYGRTLAFVHSDGMALSVALAKNGLGLPTLVQPNRRHYPAVVRAAQQARRDGVGVFDPRIGCTLASDLQAARSEVERARSMPVRTRGQYHHALVTLTAAGAAASALHLAHYGLMGSWFRRVLNDGRAAIRRSVRTVRAETRRQRRLVVAQRHHGGGHSGGSGDSGGSGGSGGSSGYTGPRCYLPGGIIWRPC